MNLDLEALSPIDSPLSWGDVLIGFGAGVAVGVLIGIT